MNATQAHFLAQMSSLTIYLVITFCYVAPWLKRQSRAAALAPLLWIHVFRYIALQVVSAQQAGFPISNGGRDQIIFGDLVGAGIALVAVIALHFRLRISVFPMWGLVFETLTDIVLNIRNVGMKEHLFGVANGITWMVTAFYVPLILVSLGLLVWQLASRRREPLDGFTLAGAGLPGTAHAR